MALAQVPAMRTAKRVARKDLPTTALGRTSPAAPGTQNDESHDLASPAKASNAHTHTHAHTHTREVTRALLDPVVRPPIADVIVIICHCRDCD